MDLSKLQKKWHDKFDKTMTGNGFHVNEGDSCVFFKHDSNGCVIICLYRDDMLIFGTDLDRVIETKPFLNSKFEMKDMGEAYYVLGIKITRYRTNKKLSLSQRSYLKNVLKKFTAWS